MTAEKPVVLVYQGWEWRCPECGTYHRMAFCCSQVGCPDCKKTWWVDKTDNADDIKGFFETGGKKG